MKIDIPPNETKKIKYGVLPNKIKYTIMQDEHIDTAFVVVTVKVGSLSEPRKYMGLAHFLEHMLFLGSHTYPDENYFSKKLNSYGGITNAFTTSFETVYYFNVVNGENNSNLQDMFDIFSRFFIDPLFDINSVCAPLENG